MTSTALLLVLGFLVLVNGLLAAAETAVLSSRKGTLRKAVKAGVKGASQVLALSETPSRFLTMIQFWVTLCGTVAGVLAGACMGSDFSAWLESFGWAPVWAWTLSLTLVSVLLALVLIVFGELIPRRLVSSDPESSAAKLVGITRALGLFSAPLVRILCLISEHAGRIAGVKAVVPSVGDDEVRALLEQGLNAGVIHRVEKEMVDRVLALDNLRVTAIMTPRPKMVFLNIEDPEETNWRKIVACGHSYFPVYQSTRDKVLGVVAVKALWANSAIGVPARLKDMVTPHLAVPDRMTAIQLLEEFKRSGRHFAIVVDEFGGVVGLITLIDVLEAIVGDLPDSAHREAPGVRMRRDGTWLADASLGLADLKALLKTDQPLPHEGDAEYETLGGFVLAQLGAMPKEGDAFEWNGWHFEVIDMDHLRVDKVLIQQSPSPAPASDEGQV